MAGPKRKEPTPPLYEQRIRFPLQLLSESAVELSGNTTYEEIGCVGFHPQLDRLEAVVFIKQPIGYGGGVCTGGTTEYVRFFLSWDGGATWEDQGLTSFTAFDIPEAAEHRLEYAVSLAIDPRKRHCSHENLPMCRAILSWSLEPPADDPTFPPPWGNVHDTVIQIGKREVLRLKELFLETNLHLPAEIVGTIDLEQEIEVLPPVHHSFAQLKMLYAKKNVEPKRFGYPTALELVGNPMYLAKLADGVKGPVANLDFDVAGILELIEDLDGDTSYEELECVGLNPDTSELIATFRTKRSWGYSGALCSGGSTEYVTFWGDFDDDGTFEACLGTAHVQVYDFEDIPDSGLEYAVSIPVDLNPYRRPCTKGPRLARIRAILSWAKPHPCGEPDRAPRWGNSEDTWIQIPSGPARDLEKQNPYIWTLCNRNVCTIDQVTGLGTGDSPFGGTINIAGEFLNATAPGFWDGRFKYKIEVRPYPGGSWQTVDGTFKVKVTEYLGGAWPKTKNVTQSVDADGFYTYLEFGTAIFGSWRRVTGPIKLLAPWRSSSDDTGLWEIRITGKDTWDNSLWVAGVQQCSDLTFRQNVVVKLDQVRPDVALAITGYKLPTDPATDAPRPAADCDTFKKDWVIHGTYAVTDEHFRTVKFSVLPKIPAHGTSVDPPARSYPIVPTAGESGSWTLDTKLLEPCGYVVLMEAWDRTVASCDGDGWYNRISVGFCLEE